MTQTATPIPPALLVTLARTEIKCLLALLDHTQNATQGAAISLKALSRATGLGTRSLSRAIAGLEARQIVTVTRGQTPEHGYTTNTYQLDPLGLGIISASPSIIKTQEVNADMVFRTPTITEIQEDEAGQATASPPSSGQHPTSQTHTAEKRTRRRASTNAATPAPPPPTMATPPRPKTYPHLLERMDWYKTGKNWRCQKCLATWIHRPQSRCVMAAILDDEYGKPYLTKK